MTGYPFTVTFDLHWGEMDAFGHVNNARYFTWFETARMSLFRELGLPLGRAARELAEPPDPDTPEIGPILASTSCDFLRPVDFPARLIVGTKIAKIGRTSFTMDYAAAHADDPDQPVAVARGIVVMVDYGTGKSVPVGDELRGKLEEYGI